MFPFSIHSLEGFLFGVHAAPFELNMDIWGYELDRLLPDPCYEDEHHVTDILELYDDMNDALELEAFFRLHTLKLPDTLPRDELRNHPLWHWITGFFQSHVLILKELDRMANQKQFRKNPSFHKMKKDFQKNTATFLAAIPIRLERETEVPPEDVGSAEAGAQGDRSPLLNLPQLFETMLKGIAATAVLATQRMNDL